MTETATTDEWVWVKVPRDALIDTHLSMADVEAAIARVCKTKGSAHGWRWPDLLRAELMGRTDKGETP